MKKLFNKWKKTAKAIGDIQASIIFSFFYFAIITPLSLITSPIYDFFEKRKFPRWELITNAPTSISKMRSQ